MESITHGQARTFIIKWPDMNEYIDFCCEYDGRMDARKAAKKYWLEMKLRLDHNQ